MIKNMWTVLRTSLPATILVVLSQGVSASGYHPQFDRAMSEAEIVVLGEIVDAWDVTAEEKASDPYSYGRKGRAYRMSVHKTYKGAPLASEEVVFWDPRYRSSASYYIEEGKTNLTFLVPTNLSVFDKKHLHGKTRILYRPIRNLSKRSDYRTEAFNGWLYLLDIVLQYPQKEMKEAFNNILSTESNRYILRYVIEHWPAPMTKADDDLLRATILKHSEDAFITCSAIDKLRERGVAFKDEDLIQLLENGSKYQRNELLGMITPTNIDLCKTILFAWLMEEGTTPEHKTTKTLAMLSPSYLKDQLRKHEMPFWRLVPCLQELGINGSAVGKTDFSQEVLSLGPFILSNIGAVFCGKEFHGSLAMENPERNKNWLVAFPLLEPILSRADSSTRRLVVALFRTFGVPVKRDGVKYVAFFGKEPVSKPVQLELEVPKVVFSFGKPINLTLKETAVTDRGLFSFQGKLGWTVESDHGWSIMSGGAYRIWDNVNLSRDKFVQLEKGSIVTSQHNIDSFIKRPGSYKVSVRKVYPHDGQCIDIDSWTGVIFSNEIEITVFE